jgi:hypothetical protein
MSKLYTQNDFIRNDFIYFGNDFSTQNNFKLVNLISRREAYISNRSLAHLTFVALFLLVVLIISPSAMDSIFDKVFALHHHQ